MSSFWHPLSALSLVDPPCFATTTLLRMFLAAGDVALTYSGDRMWPTIGYGTAVHARSLDDREVCVGSLVVATPDGVPDLLRVASIEADFVDLVADADPQPPTRVPRSAILALGRLPEPSGPTPLTVPDPRIRRRRRRLLDLREAWTGQVDPAIDPASTVLSKYDAQAPYYANSGGQELEPDLLRRIQRHVRVGGAILVLGSGSGKECFALAEQGFDVSGIDFAPAMVRFAAAEAERRGLAIDFRAGDLRSMVLPDRSLDAVLFTYDVYSFLPDYRARLALLQHLRRSLRPGGVVYLSARRLKSSYQRLMLTLQWVRRTPRDPALWGASHTRWITMDGQLHRSFVRVFTDAALAREVRAAGFTADPWKGGHAMLTPAS